MQPQVYQKPKLVQGNEYQHQIITQYSQQT